MLPAAQTTTSRGPLTRLTTPSTSLWAGSGAWPSVYARSTVASHSPARPRGALAVLGVGAPALERGAERLEPRARVRHQRQAGVLEGVDGGDVEVDEAHVGVGEEAARRGREVAPARADAEHDVGLARDRVRRRGAGGADRADGLRVVVGQRALAGLGLGHGDAGRLGELAQRLGRLRVDRAAAGDDQRAPRGAQQLGRLGEPLGLGGRAGDVPDAAGEERLGPVERLGLDVLRQRERDGAGLGRVGQHPHRGERGRNQLLGAVDAVPEARHRLEAVVDRDVERARVLELLQHRAGDAGGEDVAGQQQHRQAVDGGQRRAGDHVRRARADRRRARVRGEAVALARVAGRGVDHRLLVAREHVGHVVALLEQRLADARDVAVPEDAEAAGDQPLLDPVALGVLVGQEAHQRLGDREPHVCLLADVIGSRGSTSWPAQVSRIHAWAGSSVKRHARSPGPAITFR